MITVDDVRAAFIAGAQWYRDVGSDSDVADQPNHDDIRDEAAEKHADEVDAKRTAESIEYQKGCGRCPECGL